MPGTWELPLAVRALIESDKVDAVVALGTILQGATAHAEMLASDVSTALMQMQVELKAPIAWGILTPDTQEQAIERAGMKLGNKGREAALAANRQEATGVIGGEMNVENFEQLVAEVGQSPPEPGSALMVTRIGMDPGKIDENIAFFKSDVAPRIKGSPGFRGMRNMINRSTGEGIVGTVWSDADARKRQLRGPWPIAARGWTRCHVGEVSSRSLDSTGGSGACHVQS